MTDAQRLDPRTARACAARLGRLRTAVVARKLDGLLIGHETDIRYLTGFVGHDSLLLVTGDGAVVVTDPRYDEFLDPWRTAGFVDVAMGVRHRLESAIGELCRGHRVQRLGLQGEHVSIARSRVLDEALPGIDLEPTTGVVALLRRRKDDLEIERIEQAIDWQQSALRTTLPTIREGMTELELLARLESEMTRRGAFRASFDPIIGSGPNSSIIHHQTSSAVIGPGPLLIDWGARTPDGYASDMTRTYCLGAWPKPLDEVYRVVLEAQLAAIAAAAPGRTCAEIDAVARAVITRAGYGDRFGHGLGHGLGLDVHETPYFNDLQTDVVLEPGFVMTVEPGVYLPGIGGVRIEDDVLITERGARVLSSWPKDPDSAILEPAAAGATR